MRARIYSGQEFRRKKCHSESFFSEFINKQTSIRKNTEDMPHKGMEQMP